MLTQKKDINVSEAIRKYQDEPYGLAWDVFWDYKCETEEDGDRIFSERHILTTSLHLFSYFACFGMARGSTHLTDITVCDLAEKLRKLRGSYNDVKHTKFEMLAESDRDLVVPFFEDTAKALEEPTRVSSSITMITKIHLAAWGQTPAYDRFFKLGYKSVFNEQPIPSSWEALFNSLLFLREQYHSEWAKDIVQLPGNYCRTRPVEKNEIPPSRLIDMAFWWIGKPREEASS